MRARKVLWAAGLALSAAAVTAGSDASFFKAEPIMSQKSFTLNLVEFKGEIKPHYHKKHEELVVVVEGEGNLWIDGRESRLKPNAFFYIPKGAVHRALCKEGATCKAYSIFLPKWNPKKPDRIFLTE